MNNLVRNILIWLIIGAALMALFNMFQGSGTTTQSTKIAYSEFIDQAKTGGISEVLIEGQNLTGLTSDGRRVSSYKPDGADIVDALSGSDVRINAQPDESNIPGFLSILLSWFPMLLFIGVWIFFMRQMQGGGRGGAMGFGKSRAKLLTEHTCLLYTSPSPRDRTRSRMPSSA